MKLIIETKEPDKVTKCVKVSTRGMQILLDLFAWMDMLEPFRLTPDAPEMTVGDSSPVPDSDLNNSGVSSFQMVCTCPSCRASGLLELFDPRPEPITKPDKLTPSPTPSFR